MTAANTDLLMEVGDPGTATTLSSPGYTTGNTSVNVASTSNWPTATGVVFAIDEAEVVNNVEVQIPGTYNEYVGTVATGTSITTVDWVRGVGDRNYSAGALTRVYVPVSAERENRIVQWGRVEHAQDGAHDATKVAMLAGTQTFTGNKTFSGTVALPNNSVDANELSATAITLTSINSSTGQTGITSTPVLVTGLTTTVTIPAGGRKVRIEGSIPLVSCTVIATVTLYIYNGTTVAGTLLQSEASLIAINGAGTKMNVSYEYTPSAGSQSYCIGISTDTGTANTSTLGATRQANFSVKVI